MTFLQTIQDHYGPSTRIFAYLIIAIYVISFFVFIIMHMQKRAERSYELEDESPNKEPRPETREEAWNNAINETTVFLKNHPDNLSSDGVLPIIGWRKLA